MRIDIWEVEQQKQSPYVPPNLGYEQGIQDKFEFGELLGKGGFGDVMLVKCKQTSKEFACKRISKVLTVPGMCIPLEKQIKHIKNILREVKALYKLRGSLDVVYLKKVFEDESYVYLLMEHCCGGQLTKTAEENYSEKLVAGYMRSVLRVLANCESKRILHRDIKPSNFLRLNKKANSPIRAIDFGMAVEYQKHELPRTDLGLEGTPWYMAPEVLNSQVVPQSDVWSAGVMAYQLLSGYLPFDDKSNPQNPALSIVWKSILTEEPNMQRKCFNKVSPEAKDFISQLLIKDPAQRPSAKQALQHPWLRSAKLQSEAEPLDHQVVARVQRFAEGNAVRKTVLDMIADELMRRQPSALLEGSYTASVLGSEDSSMHVGDLKGNGECLSPGRAHPAAQARLAQNLGTRSRSLPYGLANLGHHHGGSPSMQIGGSAHGASNYLAYARAYAKNVQQGARQPDSANESAHKTSPFSGGHESNDGDVQQQWRAARRVGLDTTVEDPPQADFGPAVDYRRSRDGWFKDMPERLSQAWSRRYGGARSSMDDYSIQSTHSTEQDASLNGRASQDLSTSAKFMRKPAHFHRPHMQRQSNEQSEQRQSAAYDTRPSYENRRTSSSEFSHRAQQAEFRQSKDLSVASQQSEDGIGAQAVWQSSLFKPANVRAKHNGYLHETGSNVSLKDASCDNSSANKASTPDLDMSSDEDQQPTPGDKMFGARVVNGNAKNVSLGQPCHSDNKFDDHYAPTLELLKPKSLLGDQSKSFTSKRQPPLYTNNNENESSNSENIMHSNIGSLKQLKERSKKQAAVGLRMWTQGPEQLAQAAAVVKVLQLDKKDDVSAEHLQEGLHKLGYDLEIEEIQQLISQLGQSHAPNNDTGDHDTGRLARSQFIASQVNWKQFGEKHRDLWLKSLESAFRGLDGDMDGTINVGDLIKLLRSKLPEDEIQSAVEEAMLEAAADDCGMDFDAFVRFIDNNGAQQNDNNLEYYDTRRASNEWVMAEEEAWPMEMPSANAPHVLTKIAE